MPQLHMIDPVGYLDMIQLERHARKMHYGIRRDAEGGLLPQTSLHYHSR
ncbi:MAG: hypothetical protein U5N56_00625 [Candidatus Marinimicrobia bacterium]|nr:hypothetical protein [Candidatus Neomarinimicrobiota bacterium]